MLKNEGQKRKASMFAFTFLTKVDSTLRYTFFHKPFLCTVKTEGFTSKYARMTRMSLQIT